MNGLGFTILFLLLAAATYTSAKIKCGPNQIYTECSKPCQKTCTDPYGLDNDCREPHCECIEGSVFHDGYCIPIEKCPPIPCPANMTFQVENIYVNTCNMYVLINPKSPGCYCEPGYYLNRQTEQCVFPDECPEEGICGRNEEVDNCLTFCPETCLDRKPNCSPPFVCQTGCACKPPFIFNEETGYCIDPKDCPKPCPGEHEEYRQCGTACEEACGYTPRFCTLQCVSGCFCKPGYVRECTAKGSRCIPKSHCKKAPCH